MQCKIQHTCTIHISNWVPFIFKNEHYEINSTKGVMLNFIYSAAKGLMSYTFGNTTSSSHQYLHYTSPNQYKFHKLLWKWYLHISIPLLSLQQTGLSEYLTLIFLFHEHKIERPRNLKLKSWSSAMLHCIIWRRGTEISEEFAASVFRVQDWGSGFHWNVGPTYQTSYNLA
jgi:hypothetical protein